MRTTTLVSGFRRLWAWLRRLATRKSQRTGHVSVSRELARFRVGDVFPLDDERRIAFLSCLVASEALASAARLAYLLEPASGKEWHPADEQANTYLILWSVGAAREACRAFARADELGMFDVVGESAGSLARNLALARRESDFSDDSKSLLTEYVKPIRDKAGFHWDAEHVKAVVRTLQADTVFAVKAVSGRSLDCSIPIAPKIAQGMVGQFSSSADFGDVMNRIVELQRALNQIGRAAFGRLLVESGVSVDARELDGLET